MILNLDKINTIDLRELVRIAPDEDRHNFDKEAGQEHYRLLSYISMLYNTSLFADIGTRFGSSAIALSYNPNNIVHTFDIIDCDYLENLKPNIVFSKHNIWNDLSTLIKYSVIMLDIDPHDGSLEKIMIEFLRDNAYQGIVLLDDIGPLWPQLNEMWNSLTGVSKYDITHLGHFPGTGIINFNVDLQIQ
jgi:hypothetical protein